MFRYEIVSVQQVVSTETLSPEQMSMDVMYALQTHATRTHADWAPQEVSNLFWALAKLEVRVSASPCTHSKDNRHRV